MQKIQTGLEKGIAFLKKPIVFSFIMAFFTYLTLVAFLQLPVYDILSLLLFVMCVMLYQNTKYKNVCSKEGLLLSILFAFLMILGRIIAHNLTNPNVSFLTELLQFKNIIYLIGLGSLFFCLLMHLLPWLSQIQIRERKHSSKKKTWILFSLTVVFLLAAWLPYFLSYYPGTLSSDSLGELQMIMDGFRSLSDHHPLLHVVFMAIPYQIGMALFHSQTSAVGLISMTQMVIMASIFSYLVVYVYRRVRVKGLAFLVFLFFALSPIFGYYSITMWKDVLFGGLMVLLTMQTIKWTEKKESITFQDAVSFIFLSLLTLFFRNNAIYMYFILTFCSFFVFKKEWKKILLIFFLVISTYYFIKGPVFNMMHVQKSASAEYLAIPLQQLGRIAYKDGDFSKEERHQLKPLISVPKLKELYNPVVVDAIKFNEAYHGEVFDNNKGAYLKLWAGVVLKNPVVSVEAYLSSTLGYWYPNVEYWAVQKGVSDESYGVKNAPIDIPIMKKYVDTIETRTVPVVAMQWSIGLCVWLLFILGYITVKRSGLRAIYPFIPILGIWLTMMVASPVYAEFRYMFCAFTTLPLLFVYTMTSEMKRKKKLKMKEGKLR